MTGQRSKGAGASPDSALRSLPSKGSGIWCVVREGTVGKAQETTCVEKRTCMGALARWLARHGFPPNQARAMEARVRMIATAHLPIARERHLLSGVALYGLREVGVAT